MKPKAKPEMTLEQLREAIPEALWPAMQRLAQVSEANVTRLLRSIYHGLAGARMGSLQRQALKALLAPDESTKFLGVVALMNFVFADMATPDTRVGAIEDIAARCEDLTRQFAWAFECVPGYSLARALGLAARVGSDGSAPQGDPPR